MKSFLVGLMLLPALGCLAPGLPTAPAEPAKPATAPAAPPITETDVTEGNVYDQVQRLREEMTHDLKAPVGPATADKAP